MGPEWKYKYKSYFLFRRQNQPVSFGGKGVACHTLFSSCPAILIILNKNVIFMHNFFVVIGNGLQCFFFEPLQ